MFINFCHILTPGQLIRQAINAIHHRISLLTEGSKCQLQTLCVFVISCSTHTHTVGSGPRTGESVSKAQWYFLGGLISLNEVDTTAMAGNASNYEIKTEQGVMDIIVGIPASMVMVSRRTVTVTK